MKNFLIFLSIIFIASACSVYIQEIATANCSIQETINPNYSRAGKAEAALNDLVHSGVPGAALAVYSDEGWWTAAAGFAKIEDQTPMQVCHLHYLQSISKTYLAVAVLKLFEEGKIDLDAPFTKYLPEKYGHYITDANSITVRMLLNHTSGIPEYNSVPAYVSYLLQHPDHDFVPEDYLKYIDGKPLDFTPGDHHSYRNTNYVILALMMDELTGDHAEFISKTIFEPLGLTNTYYRNDPGYLDYPNLVNSYWDRYSNGILENVSQMERKNVSTLIGDDGIVSTPVDAVKFLKGLMEGKLLSPSTMEEMKTWTTNIKGKEVYGLGLAKATFEDNIGYGHSGGGIGAGCELYYFPEKNVYIFISINIGTVTESPLFDKAMEARKKVYDAILN